MTFDRRIWTPIALLLAVGNLAGVWFAAREAEPLHAATHAALAILFGLWAQRLGAHPRLLDPIADRTSSPGHLAARSGASESALEDLQQRVSELEERAEFAERLLSRQRDSERSAPPES